MGVRAVRRRPSRRAQRGQDEGGRRDPRLGDLLPDRAGAQARDGPGPRAAARADWFGGGGAGGRSAAQRAHRRLQHPGGSLCDGEPGLPARGARGVDGLHRLAGHRDGGRGRSGARDRPAPHRSSPRSIDGQADAARGVHPRRGNAERGRVLERGGSRVRGARWVLDDRNDPRADVGPDRCEHSHLEHGPTLGDSHLGSAGQGRPDDVHHRARRGDAVRFVASDRAAARGRHGSGCDVRLSHAAPEGQYRLRGGHLGPGEGQDRKAHRARHRLAHRPLQQSHLGGRKVTAHRHR